MKFVDFLKNVFGSLISMTKNDPDYEVVSPVEEHEEAMNNEDEATREELNRSARAVEKMAQDMKKSLEGSNKTISYGDGVFSKVTTSKNSSGKPVQRQERKEDGREDEREL